MRYASHIVNSLLESLSAERQAEIFDAATCYAPKCWTAPSGRVYTIINTYDMLDSNEGWYIAWVVYYNAYPGGKKAEGFSCRVVVHFNDPDRYTIIRDAGTLTNNRVNLESYGEMVNADALAFHKVYSPLVSKRFKELDAERSKPKPYDPFDL